MKDNKELLLHNTDDDFDEFEKALAVIAEEAYEEYVKEGKKRLSNALTPRNGILRDFISARTRTRVTT